jgi:alcohol dehydrogenase class IV
MGLIARIQVGTLFLVGKLLKVHVPETIAGGGSRERVGAWCKAHGCRRALVIIDQVVKNLGLADKLLESLDREGIEHVIYDGVQPNPTVAMAKAAAELGRQNRADIVVAIGGGSPIDCAKLAAAAITSKRPIEKLVGTLKVRQKPLPIIAVPTTAGTGSEVTVGAVISDDITHRKTIMISPAIVPVLAVLDGETMIDLPPLWTAATGFDALTHAVEAYISAQKNEDATENAGAAVSLINGYLARAFKDGNDVAARDALSMAAYKAGLAMNKCSVGYAHAFGHRLTGFYDIPHGMAVGLFLPHVLELNRKAAQKDLADLAVACELGKAGENPGELADRFIKRVFELYREVKLPQKCDKLKRSDYPAIIREAFRETNATFPVPRYLTRQEASALLDKVLP